MGSQLKHEPRWLNEAEQHDWRAFVSVLNLLPTQFERDLQHVHRRDGRLRQDRTVALNGYRGHFARLFFQRFHFSTDTL